MLLKCGGGGGGQRQLFNFKTLRTFTPGLLMGPEGTDPSSAMFSYDQTGVKPLKRAAFQLFLSRPSEGRAPTVLERNLRLSRTEISICVAGFCLLSNSPLVILTFVFQTGEPVQPSS